MLIDGEKWACEACVRGHRVSNCNHYGRPVSQCPHCRGLRKARSSHVKCECGNKGKGEDKKCCCGTGGRCTCALKKDRLDPVRESGIPSLTRSRSQTDARKPRVSPSHSHPVAMSRKNHAGADCRPYHIPRPHSIHGGQAFANSSDSLPLSTTPDFTSQIEFFPMEERMVRSEHGSPGMPPVKMRSELPHLDLEYNTLPSVTSSPVPSDFNSSFQSFDAGYIPNTTADDLPPPSAGLMEVDWQSMGLLDNAFPAEFPPAPSYASFDQGPTSHPGLTTASSSGDVSEAEEFMSLHSPVPSGRSPYTQFDDQTGMGPYNMSTESLSGSLNSMTPPPMLSNSAMGALASQMSMEPFMRGHTPQSPVPMDDFSGVGSPVEQGYGSPYRQDVPKITHSGFLEARGPSPPVMRPTPTSDPLWNAPNGFVKEENQFGTAGMQEPVWTN